MNLRKKLFLLISAFLSISLLVGYRISKHPTPIAPLAQASVHPSVGVLTNAVRLAPAVVATRSIVPNKVEATEILEYTIFKKAAKIDEKTVLAELQEDPESTPQEILDFAMDLAPIMTQSLKDSLMAEKTFTELQKCYENESSLAPVRALCYGNMKRLSLHFQGQMSSKFTRLSASADSEMKNFADQIVR